MTENKKFGRIIAGLRYYSINELVEMLNLTLPMVRKYIQKGYIRARKVGEENLITEPNLREFLKDYFYFKDNILSGVKIFNIAPKHVDLDNLDNLFLKKYNCIPIKQILSDYLNNQDYIEELKYVWIAQLQYHFNIPHISIPLRVETEFFTGNFRLTHIDKNCFEKYKHLPKLIMYPNEDKNVFIFKMLNGSSDLSTELSEKLKLLINDYTSANNAYNQTYNEFNNFMGTNNYGILAFFDSFDKKDWDNRTTQIQKDKDALIFFKAEGIKPKIWGNIYELPTLNELKIWRKEFKNKKETMEDCFNELNKKFIELLNKAWEHIEPLLEKQKQKGILDSCDSVPIDFKTFHDYYKKPAIDIRDYVSLARGEEKHLIYINKIRHHNKEVRREIIINMRLSDFIRKSGLPIDNNFLRTLHTIIHFSSKYNRTDRFWFSFEEVCKLYGIETNRQNIKNIKDRLEEFCNYKITMRMPIPNSKDWFELNNKPLAVIGWEIRGEDGIKGVDVTLNITPAMFNYIKLPENRFSLELGNQAHIKLFNFIVPLAEWIHYDDCENFQLRRNYKTMIEAMGITTPLKRISQNIKTIDNILSIGLEKEHEIKMYESWSWKIKGQASTIIINLDPEHIKAVHGKRYKILQIK